MVSRPHAVGAGGLMVSAVIITLFVIPSLSVQDSLAESNSTNNNKPLQVDIGLPIRLRIPAIAVNTTLEYVGVTDAGEMDAPKDPDNAAWYNLGPRPGEIGNAVIDGHSGWKDNLPAVFDDLYKVRKGDRIDVEDARGVLTTFVVRDIKRYDPKADSSLVFNSSDGKAHLNLITCEGVWDEASKSYSGRLVVFADKE